MASLFDTTRNFSLYTIPAAWLISIAPHFYSAALYSSASSKKFNAISPREMPAQIKDDQSVDQATKARFTRAESASANGFENIGLFAAAVAAGNAAGLDHGYLNTLSGLYLASRVAYTLIYINNTSEGMARARTGAFLSGVGIIFTLFISAGNQLRRTL